MTNKIILTAEVFGSAILIGCSEKSEPKKDNSLQESKTEQAKISETAITPEIAPPTIAEPDFVISAIELSKENEDNQKATLEKYEGKVLRVAGIVRKHVDMWDGNGISISIIGTDALEDIFIYGIDSEKGKNQKQ